MNRNIPLNLIRKQFRAQIPSQPLTMWKDTPCRGATNPSSSSRRNLYDPTAPKPFHSGSHGNGALSCCQHQACGTAPSCSQPQEGFGTSGSLATRDPQAQLNSATQQQPRSSTFKHMSRMEPKGNLQLSQNLSGCTQLPGVNLNPTSLPQAEVSAIRSLQHAPNTWYLQPFSSCALLAQWERDRLLFKC